MSSIVLCPQELYVASIVGVRRQLEAMRRGSLDRYGLEKTSDGWYKHILGAMGECAAARALKAYWPMSVNAPKGDPDVFPNYQIRTRSKRDYDLIIRADDLDESTYVLVICEEPPVFHVVGYILGAYAKHEEWLKDRGDRKAPAYWVPQSELTPIVV